jgi:hypothetical protein
MASSTQVTINDEEPPWNIDYCEDPDGPITPFRYFVTGQAQQDSTLFMHLFDLPIDILLLVSVL